MYEWLSDAERAAQQLARDKALATGNATLVNKLKQLGKV